MRICDYTAYYVDTQFKGDPLRSTTKIYNYFFPNLRNLMISKILNMILSSLVFHARQETHKKRLRVEHEYNY